jgi:tetratricopeptide (TPR) repeat protein
MVLHYLINSNKLSETGKYFGLVELEHVPVEQAIQAAYGMTAVQFEQAVKEYFKSLESQFEGQAAPKNATVTAVHLLSSPIPADTMGSSTKDVLEPQARALVAEMSARIPQHREWAIRQLQSIVADTTTDNAVAHRALAWIDMQKKDFEHATDELHTAAQLDPNDPWVRYELALLKYHQAEGKPDQFRGLSNMMQDLRAVLDWDPDFAQAYHLLALARTEGGGNNSALEAEQAAMKLNSRDESYLLGMANIYIALKKWDAATATLDRLKTSSDQKIAQAASKTLTDLPMIKKYGILPQEASESSSEQNSSKTEPAGKPESRQKPGRANPEAGTDDNAESNTPAAATAKPDMRPVRFAKGKITNVDCSQAPAAVITVISGARKLKFRTTDYKSLLLIGADQFSCDWKNVAVAVNYKAGSPEGDLVSLELQ